MSSQPVERPSLRERKRRQSRAEFIRIAERLFVTQGYEATTVEQICDEANRSVPTFYAHFENKEQVALTLAASNVERLRHLIEDPERKTDTLTVLRAWVDETTRFTMDSPEHYPMMLLVESETALARGTLTILQKEEAILTAGFAADKGTDPAQDLDAQLMATLLTFGVYTVYRHWLSNGATGDLVAVSRAVLDFAAERFSRPLVP